MADRYITFEDLPTPPSSRKMLLNNAHLPSDQEQSQKPDEMLLGAAGVPSDDQQSQDPDDEILLRAPEVLSLQQQPQEPDNEMLLDNTNVNRYHQQARASDVDSDQQEQQERLIYPLTVDNLEFLQEVIGAYSTDPQIIYTARNKARNTTQAAVLPATPQDPTKTSSAPEARYRYDTLQNARVFIYRVQIPDDLQPGLNAVFHRKITSKRGSQIAELAKAASGKLVRTMGSNREEDESVEVIIQALAALDADKGLNMVRKADWKVGNKPSPPVPEINLGVFQDQVENEAGRPVATSHTGGSGGQRDNIETPRPHCTIGLRHAALEDALSKLGITPSETKDILTRLQRKYNISTDPTGKDALFPILVVEGEAQGTGKTMFEAENQAATAGRRMIKLFRQLSYVSSRWMHEIKPFYFSVVVQGPHIQLSIHFPITRGSTTEYHMYPYYACNAVNEYSLKVFLLIAENILWWNQNTFRAEVADRLFVMAQVGAL
ncbi:hypothetical protein AYL99_11008 [Fonsecaea erecta]|uniref:DUF7924 domain-containing protein n=1 Tax=Fonsecaea erecta TaxID=1367422 RepID=A0A178Z492_9EURO|nr:hypothetical protein AYL99_11008 [Fonsecaea erecta]OAP54560.1 hypothetical protein AYL99_11008 [Fonsecaea erecta]